MELDDALTLLRGTEQSVLVTMRSDAKPQLSNVLHTVDDAGLVRISTTAGRAKYVNLTRTPWAALHVNGTDFWSYAVVEGAVTLSPVAAEPDDVVVDELVALYRSLRGEHPDWDEYRAAQVSERRLVVRLAPTRAYGAAITT
jgi:PPOX class probable F420-dependent enzyme